MASTPYIPTFLKDRIELIIREEVNNNQSFDSLERFMEHFTQQVSLRLLEIVQDEIKYKRGSF